MNQPFVMAKSLRVLPPGGGFANPFEVLTELRCLNSRDPKYFYEKFSATLRQHFGVPSGSFVLASSGKAALYKVAKEHAAGKSKPLAFVSAYTCPDVAIAIVRAGYKLFLFDIDPRTLEPLLDQALEDCTPDLVVLSNLYGLPDSLPKTTLDQALIVDDACQAGLSRSEGRRVGSRGGTGILSFGRGKVFPGMGGGGALFPTEHEDQASSAEDSESSWSGFLKSFVFWSCQNPWLYRIPASVKRLRLGATDYQPEFAVSPIKAIQAATAMAQLKRAEKQAACYKENSQRWHEALEGLNLVEPLHNRLPSQISDIVPIRYPVLVSAGPGLRNRLLIDLHRNGLGVSGSYPYLLEDYAELEEYIVEARTEGARQVAARLLTLPVHRFLNERDIKRTVELIGK